MLPALGDDASEFLPDRGLILRHGSSLQLMAQVTAVLRDSQEFGDVDPAADWEKWHSRRPEFSLYYAALIDPARDGDAAILCVLRAVLDGFPEPKPPHRQRMVIDYVTTRVEARSTGLASVIVRFVLESSRLFGANTFVLALEESCPYWMEKGFLLDEGRPLNARLNIFSDTHLLRLHSDPADAGTEEDLELAVAMEVEGEGEEEGEGGLSADARAAEVEEEVAQLGLEIENLLEGRARLGSEVQPCIHIVAYMSYMAVLPCTTQHLPTPHHSLQAEALTASLRSQLGRRGKVLTLTLTLALALAP